MNKKIIAFVMAALIMMGGAKVYSIQTPNVEEQKSINKSTIAGLKNVDNAEIVKWMGKLNDLGTRYIGDIRTCEKAHLKEDIDVFGLKIIFNASIDGWVGGKCTYSMDANIGGVGKDIREVFDIPIKDAQLASIKPQVKCTFDQTDLNMIAKILTEKHNENLELYKKMVQDPNFDLSKYERKDTKLTDEESKFLKNLQSKKACSVTNLNEIMVNFLEISKSMEKQ